MLGFGVALRLFDFYIVLVSVFDFVLVLIECRLISFCIEFHIFTLILILMSFLWSLIFLGLAGVELSLSVVLTFGSGADWNVIVG